MLEFIGHLHPLLVHFPIGILLMAVVLHFFALKEKYASFHSAVVMTVFIGSAGAFFSCLTGYVLSLDESEDSLLIARHQNLALLTTGLSLAWFYVLATDKAKWMQHAGAALTVSGVVLTGHWGGSLTHGEGYLFGQPKEVPVTAAPRPPVKDGQQAYLYADLVLPLLQEKCVTCHGPHKQKGRLRLDDPAGIMKGGEDGSIVTAGQPDASDLIRRINLPLTAKAHMPPRGKSQLTPDEISLLHFWVQSGLAFDKRVRELSPNAAVSKLLLRLSDTAGKTAPSTSLPDIPDAEVAEAEPDAIAGLQKRGVTVLPIAHNSHYLSVNFVSADSLTDQDLQTLLPLKEQLLWLDLGGKPFSDAGLDYIAQCKQLRRLNLRNTKVTDKGMRIVATLPQLTYLNLSGTAVSASGLKYLTRLSQLRSVYVFRTGVDALSWKKVQSLFPHALLDTGGYQVPTLAGDTVFIK